MPGHAGSPYWAAVDFDSEGDEDSTPSPNNRVYLDPWDNRAYDAIQAETITESSHGENPNNSLGEPISASFYYVPTKNYDSGDETPSSRNLTPPEEVVAPDYTVYGRKLSRPVVPMLNYHPHDVLIYGDRPVRNRRRSMYIEEQVYEQHPLIYEPMYGMMPPPPPGYMAPPPRHRMSLQHQHHQHPDYVMAALANKHRRHSRMADAYERYAYEAMLPEYEDWARPFPKCVPDNFHLSRYGHLQIDYSCSWNSLDRLIRNK